MVAAEGVGMSAFPVSPGLYGFAWGPASVVRVCSDEKRGVWLLIAGGREEIEVRVTRGGRIRAGAVRKSRQAPA